MFAFAFYLVGLDHYSNAIFVALGLLFGVALTALSMGGVQNIVKCRT